VPAVETSVAARPFQSFSQQAQTIRSRETLHYAFSGTGIRWDHIHHWKGKRSASLRSRSNRRKAAKRSKR